MLVLPNGFDPELPHDRIDYWVAKIKEIRAEKDEDDQSSAVSLLFNFLLLFRILKVSRCGRRSNGIIPAKTFLM